MPKLLDKIKGNKPLLYGGAAVIGVGVVLIFRHRAASAAANTPAADSASGTGESTDPAGNVGVIDPATGYVYGSPEDIQAAGNAFGTSAIDPATGIPFADEGAIGAGTGTIPPGNSPPVTQDNQSWLTAAKHVLPNGNSKTVETALLRVLAGQPVTWQQRGIFLEAVGVLGSPPGGYPKPIKTQDTGGHEQKHPVHTVTANGSENLTQIGEANHISLARIETLNPGLVKYAHQPVPKGTKVRV